MKKIAGLRVCVCVCVGVSRCVSCGLVPLAEGGATVWTASLTQCEAEDEPKGEEEDGAQYPQASEIILQDANSATHTNALVRKTEILKYTKHKTNN